MTTYEALIVDFGGVLTIPLDQAMQAFCDQEGIELQALLRAALRAYTGGEDQLIVDFEKGHISNEDFSARFAERLTAEAGAHVPPEGLAERIFEGLALEESMFEAVVLAKAAGLKTGLLSNSWGMSIYPLERFPEMFDTIVISGEVGMRKPDREIFDLTTDRLGVAPEASIFVDDHPGHLKTAQEAGMTTVLHKTPDETLAELEGLLGITLRTTSAG